MEEVTVYVTVSSAVRKVADDCRRLLALLEALDVTVDRVVVDSKEMREVVEELAGNKTLPQCCVGDTVIGTYDDCMELNEDGLLARAVREAGYGGPVHGGESIPVATAPVPVKKVVKKVVIVKKEKKEKPKKEDSPKADDAPKADDISVPSDGEPSPPEVESPPAPPAEEEAPPPPMDDGPPPPQDDGPPPEEDAPPPPPESEDDAPPDPPQPEDSEDDEPPPPPPEESDDDAPPPPPEDE